MPQYCVAIVSHIQAYTLAGEKKYEKKVKRKTLFQKVQYMIMYIIMCVVISRCESSEQAKSTFSRHQRSKSLERMLSPGKRQGRSSSRSETPFRNRNFSDCLY